MGAFCDTGENEGKPGTLAVPCYLIRHGGSWMLWDTGLGDRIAALPHGEMHWLALHGTTNARIATCSDRPQTRRHRVCRSVPPARRSHRQHRPVSKRDVHRSVVRSLVGSRKADARRGFRISNTPARTREGTNRPMMIATFLATARCGFSRRRDIRPGTASCRCTCQTPPRCWSPGTCTTLMKTTRKDWSQAKTRAARRRSHRSIALRASRRTSMRASSSNIRPRTLQQCPPSPGTSVDVLA